MTYLGADNATAAPETPPGGPNVSALDFMITAAKVASTAPPRLTSLEAKNVPQTGPGRDTDGGDLSSAGDVDGAVRRALIRRNIEGLKELDERASDEACTPAGAAQALARIACRLFELADSLGGV